MKSGTKFAVKQAPTLKSGSGLGVAKRVKKEPEFKTSKDAVKHAETMGYKEFKGVVNKARQKVLYNKNGNPKYISRDVDGHNGGAYKGANTAKDLNKKETRAGTYDKDMNRIGD